MYVCVYTEREERKAEGDFTKPYNSSGDNRDPAVLDMVLS